MGVAPQPVHWKVRTELLPLRRNKEGSVNSWLMCGC